MREGNIHNTFNNTAFTLKKILYSNQNDQSIVMCINPENFY